MAQAEFFWQLQQEETPTESKPCNDGDGGLHYISPLSLQQQGRLSGNFSTNRSMRSPNLEETKTPLQRYSIHSSTNIPFTKPLSYQRAQRQAIALDVPECLEESLDCDTITPICSPEQVVRDKKIEASSPTFFTESKQRNRIIQEIIETEQTYIQGIEVLLLNFKIPLVTSDAITLDDAQKLFPSALDKLLETHKQLLLQLQTHFDSTRQDIFNNEVLVGDIFILNLASQRFFEQYACYANEFIHSMQRLAKLYKHNINFAEFHEHIIQLKPGRLDIAAYLLTPIQRLPRYSLLIEQLVKATPKRHPDFLQLSSALEKIKDCVQRLNYSITEGKNLADAFHTQGRNKRQATKMKRRRRPISLTSTMHLMNELQDQQQNRSDNTEKIGSPMQNQVVTDATIWQSRVGNLRQITHSAKRKSSANPDHELVSKKANVPRRGRPFPFKFGSSFREDKRHPKSSLQQHPTTQTENLSQPSYSIHHHTQTKKQQKLKLNEHLNISLSSKESHEHIKQRQHEQPPSTSWWQRARSTSITRKNRPSQKTSTMECNTKQSNHIGLTATQAKSIAAIAETRALGHSVKMESSPLDGKRGIRVLQSISNKPTHRNRQLPSCPKHVNCENNSLKMRNSATELCGSQDIIDGDGQNSHPFSKNSFHAFSFPAKLQSQGSRLVHGAIQECVDPRMRTSFLLNGKASSKFPLTLPNTQKDHSQYYSPEHVRGLQSNISRNHPSTFEDTRGNTCHEKSERKSYKLTLI